MEQKTTKKERKNMAAELGRLGGRSLAKKRGKGYMKKIAKRGATARWGSK